jgi:hypothetical protein
MRGHRKAADKIVVDMLAIAKGAVISIKQAGVKNTGRKTRSTLRIKLQNPPMGRLHKYAILQEPRDAQTCLSPIPTGLLIVDEVFRARLHGDAEIMWEKTQKLTENAFLN